MATFTVTTGQDVVDPGDGALSLREAVAQANATTAADTIGFAATLDAQPLVLTGGELTLSQDVTLDGDRDGDGARVTLSGGDATRLVAITGGSTDVVLQDIVLADGRAGYRGSSGYDGGAVHLGGGSLTLNRSSIADSHAEHDGGGIYAASGTRLSVVDSSIAGNYADRDAGGISARGQLHVTGSSIVDNVSGEGAGGISAATAVIRGSRLADNGGSNGGAVAAGYLLMEDSTAVGNFAAGNTGVGDGGALDVATARIARCLISDNQTFRGDGGGIHSTGALTVTESTIASNTASSEYGYTIQGGGIFARGGSLVVRGSTITGNLAGSVDPDGPGRGGGIAIAERYGATTTLDIANSVVAGNAVVAGPYAGDPDISGAITRSNGHNVFGSDVLGNIVGDRESIPPIALFAALDPATGGGTVGPDGTVALRSSVANPVLSGGDPLAAMPTDQLGATRPSPGASLADLGAAESGRAPSTTASPNNDALTGTSAANTISAQAGHDRVDGLGGADTLNGEAGGDLLDGGPGNDRLDGGTGVDLATYASGSAAVTVDLRGDAPGDTDTARRGSTETDTLTGIEGAVGSSAADTFFGDSLANQFRGGPGKDSYTGGGGRDLYDFNQLAHSPAGSGRDVVTDFVVGTDDLDLSGVDADATVAGDQAFRFVGTAGLGTAPGAVGYFSSGGNTVVRASTDADGTAELEIQLNGLKNVTVDDFYL